MAKSTESGLGIGQLERQRERDPDKTKDNGTLIDHSCLDAEWKGFISILYSLPQKRILVPIYLVLATPSTRKRESREWISRHNLTRPHHLHQNGSTECPAGPTKYRENGSFCTTRVSPRTLLYVSANLSRIPESRQNPFRRLL
jgi:hypothetical protein